MNEFRREQKRKKDETLKYSKFKSWVDNSKSAYENTSKPRVTIKL